MRWIVRLVQSCEIRQATYSQHKSTSTASDRIKSNVRQVQRHDMPTWSVVSGNIVIPINCSAVAMQPAMFDTAIRMMVGVSGRVSSRFQQDKNLSGKNSAAFLRFVVAGNWLIGTARYSRDTVIYYKYFVWTLVMRFRFITDQNRRKSSYKNF
ncbi:hypothetical protein QTP88_009510 [Uroleucon formosanum]